MSNKKSRGKGKQNGKGGNGNKKAKPVKRVIRSDGSCICKGCGHRGHKSHTHCGKCRRKFKQ